MRHHPLSKLLENKIKSGINGISKIEGSAENQLKKYYEYAEKCAHDRGKTAHYLVFAPVDNPINLQDYQIDNQQTAADVYTLVRYSDLCHFFNEHRDAYKNEPHFDDFLRALELHSMTAAVQLHQIMEERFLRMIRKAKQGK